MQACARLCHWLRDSWPTSIISLILFPLALLASAYSQIQLAPPVEYDFALNPCGNAGVSGPRAVVADFNRDGRDDLAIVTAAYVAVFIIPGNGTLPQPALYDIPEATPYGGIAVGDFNQDGWPDIAISTNAHVYVYLNQQNGTFGPPVSYTTWLPYSVIGFIAVADFDQDGYPDIVTSFRGNILQNSQIFHNNRDGTFAALPTMPFLYQEIGVADLNRDGWPDIYGTPQLTVLLNSRGSFPAKAAYQTPGGDSPSYVAGDFRRLGSLDLVGPMSWYSYPLNYFKNNGDGTFTFSQGIYSYGSRRAIAADLDGNGTLDLLGASDNGFAIWPGNGDGTFSTPAFYDVFPGFYMAGDGIAAVDVNDDGQPDVVYFGVNIYGGQDLPVYVALNTSHPSVKIRGPQITPSVGGNNGTVTAYIAIPGLQPGATITLTASGQPDIVGQNPTLGTYYGIEILTATFDLRGAQPGTYAVVVQPANGNPIPGGTFTVLQGGSVDIIASTSGRSALRGGQAQLYSVHIMNAGTIDSQSSKVWVSFPEYLTWATPVLSPSIAGITNGTSYLEFDVPLAAGSSMSLPLFLTAPDNPSYAHQKFSLSVWVEAQ